MNASEDAADDFCRNIRQQTQGIIFLGTPHKGAQLTIVGKMVSLFGYWTGASTNLLAIVEPKSIINQGLHESFMKFLTTGCGTVNTVCVFEAERESLFGFPIMHVSAFGLEVDRMGVRLIYSELQVVEKDSAVIDGSQKIGFEKQHRDIQRFVSREDENYQDMLFWIRNWVEKVKKRTLGTCRRQDPHQPASYPGLGLG